MRANKDDLTFEAIERIGIHKERDRILELIDEIEINRGQSTEDYEDQYWIKVKQLKARIEHDKVNK